MKEIEQYHEVLSSFDRDKVLELLELAGRTCYKSDPGNASTFVDKIVRRGHTSVIEHFSVTVKFVTNRAMTHQLVRHRLAAYSQESQRYCNYTKTEKFGNDIIFIKPVDMKDESLPAYYNFLECAEKAYFDLIESGEKAESARNVLPNSAKTEIIMTCNLREWLHVFNLRTKSGADAQMRALMEPLHNWFRSILPEIFEEKR